uniref:Pectinesterase inhibitor domain-containing protein n=1 Tax=Salix viminalis TaxID=40686 RepID=A0A6N2MDI0_SALVM
MMLSKLISLVALAVVFLPFFTSPSLAAVPPSSPVSPGTLCKGTPDPSFCKSVLPFKLPMSMTPAGFASEIRALEDCRFLANLNIEFLLNSLQTVEATNSTLPSMQADNVQTLLSAVLTNQQTCLDGLQSTSSAGSPWTIVNENVCQDPCNLRVSEHKKLLQAENNDIEISDIVTCSRRTRNSQPSMMLSPQLQITPTQQWLLHDLCHCSIMKILVVAPNFVAVNMTFRNTAGAVKHQAVAVRSGADCLHLWLQLEAADDLLQAIERPDISRSHGRVFKNCLYAEFMTLINPAGWQIWSGDFALNTSYYAEYNNTGPGSNTTNRVTWPGFHVINATDAANFTVSVFLLGNDWLPQTAVPFSSGLI